MAFELNSALLYGICDLGYVHPNEALEAASQLLAGGVDILQLRAKGHNPDSLAPLAEKLQALCRAQQIPFVVNDHLELAQSVGADGLHLGQDDGDLASARAVLPPGTILGRSTHSLEQARAALAEGADYLGFGPLFVTNTKPGRPAIGLGDIAAMERELGSQVPVFCIGGVNQATLPEVLAAGARRVCIVSELLQAEDRAAATRSAKDRLLTSR